ncbi:hypothetical protein, partial [Nonomuraea sp. NPDC049784]|uniref:hypothetical protein n=1 Tax=Nonomuraea sp. NPDC049784 TaxID=3154361 RepID=UPI00340E287E
QRTAGQLALIHAATVLKKMADDLADQAAHEAGQLGLAGFPQLGEAAGITRQSARERWRHLIPEQHRRRSRRPAPPPAGSPAGQPAAVTSTSAALSSARQEPSEPATAPVAAATVATRPPMGLLSEPLWRVMAELHAAGAAGLSIDRHMGAWQYLEERRGCGYVTADCPKDGQLSRSERRWLTAAGHEHVAAHAEQYRVLYPHIVLREPGSPALQELEDPALWQTLVDVTTGTREPTIIPGCQHRPHRAAAQFRERLHDRGLVAEAADGYHLTEAGRAHYAAHWSAYIRRWPDINAPELGHAPSPNATAPSSAREPDSSHQASAPTGRRDHRHEDQDDKSARVPQLRAAPQLGEDYQTARWPHESDRLHLLHHGQSIGYVTGYTGRWRALTPGHDPITLDAVGPDAAHRTQAQALAAIALYARYQKTQHAVQTGTAAVDDGQALTEAPGEGLAGQDASAVPAAPEQVHPVDQQAPAAPAAELHLVRLGGEDFLFLADGQRVGWLQAAPDGWQVHGRDGRLVTTVPADDAHGRDVVNAARLAAAALGIPGAEHAAVTVGPLTDDRGRIIDTSPTALAAWSLLKGRVPGRTDVIVRGRCVGWLQRDDRGRDVACTPDGPVPGSASTNRVQAVTALLATLLAPAPLPDLGPEARPPRRPRARSAR